MAEEKVGLFRFLGKGNDKDSPSSMNPNISESIIESETLNLALRRLRELHEFDVKDQISKERLKTLLEENIKTIVSEVAERFGLPEEKAVSSYVRVQRRLASSLSLVEKTIRDQEFDVGEFINRVREAYSLTSRFGEKAIERAAGILGQTGFSGDIKDIEKFVISSMFLQSPARAAIEFLHGRVNLRDVDLQDVLTPQFGTSLRSQTSAYVRTAQEAERIPGLPEEVRTTLREVATERIGRLGEYLNVLNNRFKEVSEQLRKVTDENAANELKEELAKLAKEIAETTKTIDEANKELQQERTRFLQELASAMSPIGGHVAGATRSPVLGLFRESLNVAFRVGSAVYGAPPYFGFDFWNFGRRGRTGPRAPTPGPVGPRTTPSEGPAPKPPTTPATPRGTRFFRLPAWTAGASIALGVVLGQQAGENTQAFQEQALVDLINNASSAEEVEDALLNVLQTPNTVSSILRPFRYASAKFGITTEDLYKRLNETNELYNSKNFKTITENLEKLSESLDKASDSAQTFSVSTFNASTILSSITTSPLVGAGIGLGLSAIPGGRWARSLAQFIGGLIPGLASRGLRATEAITAGALAGLANFTVGAVDIGMGEIGNIYQGATGLNLEQYLELTGGRQSLGALMARGILPAQALRLGFSQGEILRGYEIFQRQMPVLGMSAEQMVQLLDRSAQVARDLGMRLDEIISFRTLMRRTMGPGAEENIEGIIAGFGADRTGRFNQAFSAAVARGFVEGMRQLAMQGVYQNQQTYEAAAAIRQLFMQPERPEYLRTLFETSPQATFNVINTFGGLARGGAAGTNPFATGLMIRAGLTFNEAARGGPEVALRMMEQLISEAPLIYTREGELSFMSREYLSMLSAQFGLNPDILIEFAEAYRTGGLQRAREQARIAFFGGRAREEALRPETVQRSPQYEENLRLIRSQQMRLAETAETFMDSITAMNSAILSITDSILSSSEAIYKGTKFIIERTNEYLKKAGIKDVELEVPEEPTGLSPETRRRAVRAYAPTSSGVPVNVSGKKVILEVVGNVIIKEEQDNFEPENG